MQKAKGKGSIQSDVMFEIEIVHIMLESYSRNELDSQLYEDLESDELHRNNNPNRSLLDTNSKEISGVTTETARV